MATDAKDVRPTMTDPEGTEWEDIGKGLGDEWDFEQDGTLIAHFIGSKEVETTKIESGKATALQFAPINEPDAIVFVWASSELSMFVTGEDDRIRVGDLVKIQFLGIDQFKGADGKPRQIKRYRVQAAKRG